MNREIRFRAWDKRSKRWLRTTDIAGWEIAATTGKVSSVPVGWNGSEDDNDFEIMQYTGLKDKNGVEIYEGDIVRYGLGYKGANARHDNGVVVWESEGAYFRIKNVSSESGLSWNVYSSELWSEVIGNIYENPELVK